MGKIRLTESQLHRVIDECVKKCLNELSRDTVSATIQKMRERGANERADELGRQAVRNYGGKELSDAGYTSRSDNRGNLRLGYETDMYRRNRTGAGDEDEKYNKEKRDYDKKSSLGKFFSKEPQKPKQYGEPAYVKTGKKQFNVGGPRTSDPKIARQAAKFSRWAGNEDASSSDYRK